MASEARAGAADDPVTYFLDEITYHGRTERTRRAYERVLGEYESFLAARNESVASAGRRDCMAWVHDVRNEVAPSTVATYASYVHRFYRYMNRVGALEGNPMAVVIEEMDESIDQNPDRREISVAEMRSFVADTGHPLHRGLIVTLLKTGIRVGELSNLDLRDLYLADESVAAAYGVDPRPAIDGRPDSLYVPSEPARGDTYNGEERTASNKRQRSTVIPVDAELKRVLTRWLAIRPDTASAAEPLFVSTSEWGRRVTPSMVRSIVTERAETVGWHRPGGGAEENVTPHYFRHFFTTHLRDRTGDRGVVKYLRGDVADDIIDTYTHNWGDRVREVYEEHVYSLL
jgi:site-specific recombinase XerD